MKTTRDGLTDIISRVNAVLDPHEFPARTMYVVNLVLEEILTNIIKYGFDDDEPHDVEVKLVIGSEEILIEFEDSGREFDPLSVPLPPRPESLLDVVPGGQGIHLVKEMASSVGYRRECEKNILTVRVRLRET